MQNSNIKEFTNKKVLVTGGAGFIGSNLVEKLLELGNLVVCLDNFLTGKKENINAFINNSNFKLIEGDIRNYETCKNATKNIDYVFHNAALGSVPRSINDPITTNDININGFLNVITAAKEQKIKRFIYAASSSTYGDSKDLPKVEDKIGKPMSPYAITKYVNELYASNFSELYGLETIGLRYFNVFGKKQDTNGPYAAVIPKFVQQLVKYESPIINGDGEYSRDFTFVDNVIHANLCALTTSNKEALNTVFNVAYGQRTTLNQLFSILNELLSKYDHKIAEVKVIHGNNRKGDIPHSLASIEKAQNLLGYNPQFDIRKGLEKAIDWYWNNLKN